MGVRGKLLQWLHCAQEPRLFTDTIEGNIDCSGCSAPEEARSSGFRRALFAKALFLPIPLERSSAPFRAHLFNGVFLFLPVCEPVEENSTEIPRGRMRVGGSMCGALGAHGAVRAAAIADSRGGEAGQRARVHRGAAERVPDRRGRGRVVWGAAAAHRDRAVRFLHPASRLASRLGAMPCPAISYSAFLSCLAAPGHATSLASTEPASMPYSFSCSAVRLPGQACSM